MKENRTRKDSESENAKGVADDLIKKKKFILCLFWMGEMNEEEAVEEKDFHELVEQPGEKSRSSSMCFSFIVVIFLLFSLRFIEVMLNIVT